MTILPIPELCVFMALVLLLALYGLTVSGHFPIEFRAPTLKSSTGNALIWGTLVVSTSTAVVALAIAWQWLPLAVSIIGGGAMVLFAPLVLQSLPNSFVDGRRGLVTLTGLSVAIAVLGRVFLS